MHDVCVVGAGVAGATCATLLARRGFDVVIVDPQTPGSHDRRELLSPACLRVLAALDLEMPQLHATVPCRGVLSRWAGDEPAFFDYELCECANGLSVSRREIARALLACAVAAGARIESGKWRAERHVARQTIDATGRSGRIVPEAFTRHLLDRSVCLWMQHRCAMRHSDMLIIDRTPHGWWYALSSSDRTAEIAFVTDGDCLPAPGERDLFFAEEYRRAPLLSSLFAHEPSFANTRAVDARTGYRATIAGATMLAVGEAAVALDPLSGNGTRWALQGAAYGADAIEHRLRTGASSGIDAYLAWCSEVIAREQREHKGTYQNARCTPGDGVFWQRRVSG
jgi:flavin-dependent dehydrogenase